MSSEAASIPGWLQQALPTNACLSANASLAWQVLLGHRAGIPANSRGIQNHSWLHRSVLGKKPQHATLDNNDTLTHTYTHTRTQRQQQQVMVVC
jgi:hypothetical protein